jgi:hypothetical protein
VKPHGSRDESTVNWARLSEREPQDPLAGNPMTVVEASTNDAVPVRHLAHRILEALS